MDSISYKLLLYLRRHWIITMLLSSLFIWAIFFWEVDFTRAKYDAYTFQQSTNEYPLIWLDNERLYTGKNNTVYLRDTTKPNSTEAILTIDKSNGYINYGWSCFSQKKWALSLWGNPPNSNSSGLRKGGYYISFSDGKISHEKLQKNFSENTNRFDCKFLGKHRKLPKAVNLENRYIRLTGMALHLVSSDVADFTSQADASSDIDIISSLSGSVKLTKLPVEFDTGVSTRSPLRSIKDTTSNKYFWYLTTKNFDAHDNIWPIPGWWVDGNLDKVEPVKIPQGLWVRKISSIKHMSCFSCGCGCYSNMRMYAMNGELLIQTWGRSVHKAGVGIFRLSTSENLGSIWERLTSDQSSGQIRISPNGCKVAYLSGPKKSIAYFSGELKIIDICA